MKYYEVNFDGLPGPTHLFSGLSKGNIASTLSEGQISRPRAAALQSLEKIRLLYSLGLKQAIIPPQIRPDLQTLEIYGFTGEAHEILEKVYQEDQKLFRAILSSSSMWAANAATVSPSLDTQDGKLHITIANLRKNFHRSIEAFKTYNYFRQVFSTSSISIHSPLVGVNTDEGAANHLRLCPSHKEPGVEVFVYNYSLTKESPKPQTFPARQSLEACRDIISLHKLEANSYLTVLQNPEAVDQGVFHNDVISTANENFFIYHEKSFLDNEKQIAQIKQAYLNKTGQNLICREVSNKEMTVAKSVSSYFFNSQIVTRPKTQSMTLIAPVECQEDQDVKLFIDKLIQESSNPIDQVIYSDIQESMQNGGGPACLRLRIVMNEEQLAGIKQEVIYNDDLDAKLENWIKNYYPETLKPEDLFKNEVLTSIDQCFKKSTEIFKTNFYN